MRQKENKIQQKESSIDIRVEAKIEQWKKRLLDVSRRNNLIDIKRSTLQLTSPDYALLYKKIVEDEQTLSFPLPINVNEEDNEDADFMHLFTGDILTNINEIKKLQHKLRLLRRTARAHEEERGVNALYLTFGTLEWRENEDSECSFKSPLILVPVNLTVVNLKSPFKLSLGEDEVVLNPTLKHKLSVEFGIELPDFKEGGIDSYLLELTSIVKNNQWEVGRDVYLSIMSYQKVNMYNDLLRHKQLVDTHPMLAALAGKNIDEKDKCSIGDFISYPHDNDSPESNFQIIEADSSQMDAIKLARKGFSFVLQGPPGTGKSQTITNIIAEALADGKKVLFVSEKMAALQVVYNKLKVAELSDFCLSLHDTKMKKKELLQDLEKTLHSQRVRLADGEISKLTKLEVRRKDVNEYPKQLHTRFSDLNITPYYANGKLASLEVMEDLSFPIDNLQGFTQEKLCKVLDAVKQLQSAINGASLPIQDNPWVDSNIRVITNDCRQRIDYITSSFLKLADGLLSSISDISTKYGISGINNFCEVQKIIEILIKSSESPKFKLDWLDMNLECLSEEINHLKSKSFDYFTILSLIQNDFDDSVLSIDVKEIKVRLEESSTTLSQNCQIPKYSTVGQFVEKVCPYVNPFHSKLTELYKDVCSFASILGINAPQRIDDIERIIGLANILYGNKTQYIPLEWLGYSFNADRMRNIISLHEELNPIRNAILEDYDREVLDLEYRQMLKSFRTSYSGFWGKFKTGYRKDIKTLKACLHNASIELDSKEAIRILEQIKSYRNKVDDLSANEVEYSSVFGSLYNGLQTDWTVVESLISVTQKLHEYFNGVVPHAFRRVINDEILDDELIGRLCANKTLQDYKVVVDRISNILEMNIEDVLKLLEVIEEASSEYHNSIKKVSAFTKHELSDWAIFKAVENIDRLCDIQLFFNNNDSQFKDVYGEYYSGVNTSWNEILTSIQYLTELKGLRAYGLCSTTIKEGICSNSDFIRECGENARTIEKTFKQVVKLADDFYGLFDESGIDVLSIPINEIRNKVALCKEHSESLQDWINFKNAKQTLIVHNLKEFVDEVVKRGLCGDSVVGAFEKRFYNLWLDFAMNNFTAVGQFQGNRQNEKIEEFKHLDEKQFGIAKARIRERLYSKMPNIYQPTPAVDEMSILRRELNKQRKIMPLRQLFSQLPNVIMDIKPCFMMSPLSVSVFLNADTYKFDLVIFDEASQVCTEDAVGAIMRGRQIIIVGDSKQLPPTNFFKANLNNDADDYDEDDEEFDELTADQLSVVQNTDGAYQSILEEAMSVLHNQSLRWHYRSKHEDLIAFSNYKIYNGNLITFPSSTERSVDNGVEYIEVNGVYGTPTKRVNREEALKVADLVFEHYRKYPDRSLGVIANSVSQQDAIEAAVRKKRLEDDSLEEYFWEDRKEPFFVKNLETVQGDERDTIIFSIGYGKDANGRMRMNFGPLNSVDGYRRLNVAVTRAKYNIKLVGSISYTDIDVSRTANSGVGLLRSYIEFAVNGLKSLGADTVINYDNECESPFEQSVYDFLRNKNYEVVRQVGCSGYRIDLAVKHPNKASKFILAIECDGATYHSSRTARERDWLRQSILAGMGWHFYRIWSTDWIRNPAIEKKKLINAIEWALSKSEDECPPKNIESTVIPEIKVEPKYREQTLWDQDKPDYQAMGFKKYSPAKTSYKNTLWAIIDIIKKEQPLSFSSLCKSYSQSNVTESVRNYVRTKINEINVSTKNGRYYEWRKITNNAQIIIDEEDFVYFEDIEHIDARMSRSDDNFRRNMENISKWEIWKALHLIVTNSWGITIESAITATAKVFGWNMGPNINANIRNAIKELFDLGLYSLTDCKLQPNLSAIETSKYAFVFRVEKP